MKNNIGVIGLGVMGKNIALNMISKGYKVAGYNRSPEKVRDLNAQNIQGFDGHENIEEFIASLQTPRKVFLMVPAGNPVDLTINAILPLLEPNDIIMDGGNSFHEDTTRRAKELAEKNIHYFGVGVSGGEEGALLGPSIMPSGDAQAYTQIGPILESISAHKDNQPCCTYIGPEGSGHYVKMVHNGIEYADMQLLAETYLILKYAGGYTNQQISQILEEWQKTDVQSYLVEITSKVLKEKDPQTPNDLIDMIVDIAGNKGTGRWTSIEALKQEFNASLLTAAYHARIMSNQTTLRETFNETNTIPTEKLDLNTIFKAYSLSKTLAFAQGFGLYKDASEKFGWNLNLKEIASIFRAGCIIQAQLLQEIMQAYEDNAEELLLHPRFATKLTENKQALKETTIIGLKHEIALPLYTNALTFINQITNPHLGANIIQAQRDYFGAHTYQRTDNNEIEHHNWGETND